MVLTATDRDSLHNVWRYVVANSVVKSRSVWLVFFNSQGRVARKVLVISDVPLCASSADADVFASCAREILLDIPHGSVAVLATRADAQRISHLDQDWAECLTKALGRWGIRQWPVAVWAGKRVHFPCYSR